MIGIEWDVREFEAPVASRGRLPAETAHGVRNLDGRAGNHAAGWILHYAFDRTGISQLRLRWPSRQQQNKPQNKCRPDAQSLQHFFSIPSRAICVVCGKGRRKNGGGTGLQMGQRTEIRFK